MRSEGWGGGLGTGWGARLQRGKSKSNGDSIVITFAPEGARTCALARSVSKGWTLSRTRAEMEPVAADAVCAARRARSGTGLREPGAPPPERWEAPPPFCCMLLFVVIYVVLFVLVYLQTHTCISKDLTLWKKWAGELKGRGRAPRGRSVPAAPDTALWWGVKKAVFP